MLNKKKGFFINSDSKSSLNDGSDTTSKDKGMSLSGISYNKELYGGRDMSKYDTSIAVGPSDSSDDDEYGPVAPPPPVERDLGYNKDRVSREPERRAPAKSYTAPKEFLREHVNDDAEDDVQDKYLNRQIFTRESEYQRRRFDRALSPERKDPFAKKSKRHYRER